MSLGTVPRAAGLLVLLGLVACLAATPAYAQSGAVVGVVVDAETGETLIGANVVVEGTTTGSTTDADGRYEIRGLSPGSYTLAYRYIGYDALTVRNVEVRAQEATRLDVRLTPEAIGLGEVIVEARAVRNTEAALLRDRQRAAGVSDAISAEGMSRSGAGDAAAAMARVAGATIQDGRYVVVRGLGDRYSATQLNGVRLPSPDPDRNAAPLDLLPASLLDRIVTLKTFTPDRPGNFSGGLVDVGTRSFPERFTLSLSTSTSVNSSAHFSDAFLVSGASQDLPDALAPGEAIPDEISARTDPALAEKLDAQSRAFHSSMAPAITEAPLNQNYAFSIGNRARVLGRQVGYVGSVTYNRAASYRSGTTGRYSVTEGASVLTPDLLVEDAAGTVERSLGGLVHLSARLSPGHELGLTTVYSRNESSAARFQDGWYPGSASANDSTTFLQNRVLEHQQRDLRSGQVRGEHRFPALLDATVSWSAATARTRQNEPDLRFFANTVNLLANGDTLYGALGSGIQAPSRYYRDLSEANHDAKLDVAIPFRQWNSQSAEFKMGAAFTQVDRTFRERLFQVYTNSGNALRYERTFNDLRSVEDYFNGGAMGIVDVDTLGNGATRYQFVNYVREASKSKNNYDGEQTISAAYAMVDLPISRRLRAIGGVRLESTRMNVVSADVSQPVGRVENVDLLPSLNLVYRLTDAMNLRAAATRTLARPTFREVAPFESFDFILGSFYIGNPELRRTLVTNADLRWEWFVRPGEIVAMSAFAKTLDDPIERAIVGGTNGQRKFVNVDQARMVGLEFELRKRLDSVARAFRNFSVGGNGTVLWSQIRLAENELRIRRAIDPGASSTRALQGQSPYVVNADVRFDDEERGTAIGLHYNVFGRRLAHVSLGATPDVFERPRPVLDFTASQRLSGGLSLKLSIRNLLNSPHRETYRYRGQDFSYYEYEFGRTYSLGASYSL